MCVCLQKKSLSRYIFVQSLCRSLFYSYLLFTYILATGNCCLLYIQIIFYILQRRMSALKTFRIKRILSKKMKQNRPIPQWIRWSWMDLQLIYLFITTTTWIFCSTYLQSVLWIFDILGRIRILLFSSRCQRKIFKLFLLLLFDPGALSKNFRILTQKSIYKLSEIWSGLFIPDPDPDFSPIPSRIQGSKRHRIPDPDPQHCPTDR
jgi:hypothetical protein